MMSLSILLNLLSLAALGRSKFLRFQERQNYLEVHIALFMMGRILPQLQ